MRSVSGKSRPLSAAEKWRRLRRFVLHEQLAFKRMTERRPLNEEFTRGVASGYRDTRSEMSRLSRVRVRRTK